MKKVLALVALIALVVPVELAGATTSTRATAPLFVAGGTLLTNGIFFPGTAVYNDGTYYGAPYQIARGTDIELTNVDEGSVANGHALRSFKLRRNGRPLFASARLDQPGETTLVITSHLKPGIYPYFCMQHTGMLGRLEVTS